MASRLTADDFFTGLIAALALKGREKVSLRGGTFDRALVAVFDQLQADAPKLGLDIRFRIRPHSIHGDSVVARDSITHAAQRGLISLDNPEFQDISLILRAPEAERLLDSLPGGKSLYTDIAEKFVANAV